MGIKCWKFNYYKIGKELNEDVNKNEKWVWVLLKGVKEVDRVEFLVIWEVSIENNFCCGKNGI